MSSSAFESRWFAYAAMATSPLWVFLLIYLGQVGGGVVASAALFGSLGAFALLALWTFIGYYFDAKHLRAEESEWAPVWWFWMIAHSVLSPFIVAPVYLWVRTKRTGMPERFESSA